MIPARVHSVSAVPLHRQTGKYLPSPQGFRKESSLRSPISPVCFLHAGSPYISHSVCFLFLQVLRSCPCSFLHTILRLPAQLLCHHSNLCSFLHTLRFLQPCYSRAPSALPYARPHGSLLSPAGVCLPEMALPSGLPYRKPHLSFRMRPYIPENRSSSPCAAGSCSGSDPLSAVPGTSIACAVLRTLSPEGMAYHSFHPSQGLRSALGLSCHPSAGCYLPAPSSVSQHKDSPERH